MLTAALLTSGYLLLAPRAITSASSHVIYVNASSSGASPDGASWATAYTTLQDALAMATGGDEIWVSNQ